MMTDDRRDEPEADVKVENHGSVFLFRPLTGDARDWIDAHIDPDAQRWGSGVVVEPRFVEALAAGMAGDGLEVE